MCTCDYRINNDYSRAVNHCIQVVSEPRRNKMKQDSPSRSLFLSAQRAVHCDAFETLYRSLSLSLKIEPFLRRAWGPKYFLPSPSPFLSIGQCLNDYSNEAHHREGFDICFLFGFHQNMTATGHTSRINVSLASSERFLKRDATREAAGFVTLFAHYCA